MEIIETTTMQAWKSALMHIKNAGDDFIDHDGRKCREVLNLNVTIEDPKKDFEKPIDLMQGFEWVYPTKEELSSIILNKQLSSAYAYTYGPRIFNFLNQKDQINDFVIPLLKNDPTTRRAIISLFNPASDSNKLSKNMPSLLFIYFKIKKEKLELTCFIRSNDFFIGWPGNIYQMYILQKYVADKLNVQTGQLVTISCSAHIFHEHFEKIDAILQK